MPDSVIVTLFNGRTVTMAQVRQEHNIRMQRFANAHLLGNTACLYFPAGVSGYAIFAAGWGTPTPPLLFDFDPLITDSAVCSAGGGY